MTVIFSYKAIASAFAKFVLSIIIEFRRLYYHIFLPKRTNVKVNITADKSIKLSKYGDIAELLYICQPLVRFKKSFEYETFSRVCDIVNEGDYVIDIGANIGVYTILLSKLVGVNGRVLAFEPHPHTADILEKNLNLNECNNVRIHKLALSNVEEKVHLVTPNIPSNSGDSFNYMETKSTTQNSSTKGNTETVVATTLDKFIAKNNYLAQKISFIKMDVEGAEYLVFQGGEELMNNSKPKIIFESNSLGKDRFNYSTSETLNLLMNKGYSLEEYEYQQWLAF